MKPIAMASHRDAGAHLEGRTVYNQALRCLTAPSISVGHGVSAAVRRHIENCLLSQGWASPVEVSPGFNVELNLSCDRTVLQLQTGNVARAFYDLMKMQSLHQQGQVDCGILVVPMAEAARRIGGNLAQFERIRNELEGVFFDQITIPVLLIGFA